MDVEKRRQIASKGGKAAHAQGRAHEFTSEEAIRAGRRGGTTVSRDRTHMGAIGALGGAARGRAQRARAEAERTRPPPTPVESGELPVDEE